MRDILRYVFFCGLLSIVHSGFGQSTNQGPTSSDPQPYLSILIPDIVNPEIPSSISEDFPQHCFQAIRDGVTIYLALAFMGSNQAVHPDVYYWEDSFGPEASRQIIGINRQGLLDTIIAAADTPRWKYWMTMTPSPYGSAFYENPTVRVSNERQNGWKRPYAVGISPTNETGTRDTVWVRDPVTTYGQPKKDYATLIDPDTIWDQEYRFSLKPEMLMGHNSDPEFVYDSTEGKLYLVFRSNKPPTVDEILYGFYSYDGINWNQRDTLIVVKNDQPFIDYYSPWNLISPTISRAPNGNFWLWSIDFRSGTGGTQMIRMEIPRIGDYWIKVDTCTVQIPIPGKQLWHMKISRWPGDGKYYMLGALNPLNTNTYDTLGEFLFASQDGLIWDYVDEVVKHGNQVQWDYRMYRASFIFEPNENGFNLPIWYSAAGINSVWGIGYAYAYMTDISGDFNNDCAVNLIDILSLVAHIYDSDGPLIFEHQGDCNGDCRNNLLDILYLIGFIYFEGPGPLEACSVIE